MDLLKDHCEAETNESAVIQEVCAKAVQGITEPAHLWEALEAKGIAITPGLLSQVYQAISHLHNQQQEATGVEPGNRPPEGVTGLTAVDLEVVASLAERAGGVEQLMRILAVMRQVPK